MTVAAMQRTRLSPSLCTTLRDTLPIGAFNAAALGQGGGS
jgi:hypothetical protein